MSHLPPNPTKLLSLPDDLLLLVLTSSRVDDILAARYTCRRLYRISKLRWLWTDTLKQRIINKGLRVPAPANDIHTLASHDLETRTVHAARFHENWTCGRPQTKRSLKFLVHPTGGSVTIVKFLPSRNGELVLTITDRHAVRCWDVSLGLMSGPVLIAEWSEDLVTITDIVVNEDRTSPALFAALTRNIFDVQIVVFSLDRDDGKIIVLRTERGEKSHLTPLHSLNGDIVLCGDLRTYNWRKPGVIHRFNYPTIYEDDEILTAKSVMGYMITVRQQSIHAVPDPLGCDNEESCELAGQAAELNFDAKEATVVARTLCNTSKDGTSPTEAITILLRCSDGGFETIRQYDLIPRPKPHTKSEISRFPFYFPTVCTRVIPVAPSCSHLQFSPSGKGLWLETRNIPTGIANATRPARCIIGVNISNEPNLAMTSRKQEWGNFLNIGETEVYKKNCGMRELLLKKYQIQSVDLEDCVGRIAIGDLDGNMEVLEYA